MTDQIDMNFLLTSLEDELHSAIETHSENMISEYYSMMAYHLG